MKPVYQTVFDSKNGNCMQACVASIFEVPLEVIPNFMGKGVLHYERIFNAWCKDLSLISFDITPGDTFDFRVVKNHHWIGLVPSVRLEGFDHAVVYKGDQFVHDPIPKAKPPKEFPKIFTIFLIEDLAKYALNFAKVL